MQIVSASGQGYLRGAVTDEKNAPLINAKIVLHSTGYVYHSGGSGLFGIITPGQADSITVSMDGYQPVSMKVDASAYQSVIMKLLSTSTVNQQNKLLSFTRNLQLQERQNWRHSGESYSSLLENEFVNTTKYPETGFAIRIDKASYSNVRRFLNMNMKVPPDAVRAEELLSYFNFGYTPPVKDSVFAFNSFISDCPWNPANQLFFLNVSAKKIPPDSIPASNLVFLIDISGSMDMPNRLPLLKSAFKLLVDNLREKDTISIVVYGSAVGVWLAPTSGNEKTKIRKAIEDLNPAGSTPGQSGILSAYRLAKSQFIVGGNNRVILATDGDFNVGQTSEEELENLITRRQESGIYLTCLGVGMGNYKDSKLEVLAKKGNGNFSYLDNEQEAEKVLVKELTQTLYTVADDAYLNIKFNDRYTKAYRLIGYDNKLKAMSDSITTIEGGEVGSGYSLTALFEIVPASATGDTASFTAAPPETFSSANPSLGAVTVHYRLPADSVMQCSVFQAPADPRAFSALPPSFRFASSVALFASLLKESKYAKTSDWNTVTAVAGQSYDLNDPVQTEFITMIEKAKKIYAKSRKKKYKKG